MNNQQQDKRLQELTELMINGALTDELADELILLCQRDPDLATELIEQLQVDNLISQSSQPEHKSEDFIQQVMRSVDASRSLNNQHRFFKTISTSKQVMLAWALGIMGLLVALFFSIMFVVQTITNNVFYPKDEFTHIENTNNELLDDGVAMIVNAVAVEHSDQFIIGQSVSPGILQFSKGIVELEFYQGAQLKVAAPATLEIIDASKVILHQGKVITNIPTVAIGFTIDTTDTLSGNRKSITLGKHTGLEVNNQGLSQIHIFDGQVVIRDHLGDIHTLNKGAAATFQGSQLTPALADLTNFNEFDSLPQLTSKREFNRHEHWIELSESVKRDPSLIAYYDFEYDSIKNRTLVNHSSYGQKFDGAIVGATWGKGPWSSKSALEFKRPGDRVKIDIPLQLENFTLTTWIKIDSLDRYYNAILLTDGYDPGEIHWQLGRWNNPYGTIVLGLVNLNKQHKNYNHGPFFSVKDSGRWFHLATSVNQNDHRVRTYINGQLVKSYTLTNPSEHWTIGNASIGNWDSEQRQNPLRNLNGSLAELMIFNRELSEDEIKAIALIK